MKKTIEVPGLGAFLKRLNPLLTQIVGGKVTLSPGVTLDVPDEFKPITLTAEGPSSTRIDIAPLTIHVNNSAMPGLLRWLGISATEKLTALAVAPDHIDASVGMFTIRAVDGGQS